MKIIIVQENLKNAMTICGRAIGNSSSLPILGNVLLTIQDGMLKISATNLEIGITQKVRCKIESEGSVSLPARLFIEIVSNLPSGPITLEVVPDGLLVVAGKFRTTLKTVPAEDFPLVNDIMPEKNFPVPVEGFKRGLERVLFSVSTNETQAELCGVSLVSKLGELVMTGTDRYRLAESKILFPSAKIYPLFAIIVPSRAISEVLKLLHDTNLEVRLGVTDNQAVFQFGETIITTRLVDGQYPEYEAIIPKEFSVTIIANRQDFLAALKTVSVFAKSSSGVSVSYEAGRDLIFSAKSQDAGEGTVEVSATVDGRSDTVLFNHKYLLDLLPFLTSEDVCIKLNNPSAPVIFSGVNDKDYLYLVMPIKT